MLKLHQDEMLIATITHAFCRPQSPDLANTAVQVPAAAASVPAIQDAASAEIASSLLNLKASPSLVQAFLRSRSGEQS